VKSKEIGEENGEKGYKKIIENMRKMCADA
jgi:hypothetical protein